ncbi:hypothetical protein JDV02_000127 [Purpureocillium takamizusanense]|uniref:UDP-glucoronosyl and UDP-glucosyl transferase family protein n=1 Tax=Purpureocillium takamizusanense TaxID=2060973 RepID=A0A9Q8Q6R5_9HYPO|nr:uncharacterized protein JDV02_000127 [Purpureocillium takamizusanense]UNI13378.1 hypothetical protein JDV02_000127 [Purpureocillium takamizusanense]
MDNQKKVLMLTNSELGQANVFLAVAHELLQLDSRVQVDICSFAPLANHVSSITQPGTGNGGNGRVSFIQLSGPSWKEALFGRPDHQFQELCDIRPTVWNVAKATKLTRIGCPWTPEEACDTVKQLEQIITDTKPDLIVVDNAFPPAVTICYKLKPNWVVLSPNTYKEFALAKQPNQQYYWKYPPPRSTIPFPVPWYQIPLVYYMVRKMFLNDSDTWMLQHVQKMKETIDTDYADWAYISIVPPEGLKILLAARPEIDFPFDVMPKHMIPCGPILKPTQAIGDADPDLAKWLARRPTVFVNLGTHASVTEKKAVEMAKALRHLLQRAEKRHTQLQVLWKLHRRGDYELSSLSDVLGEKWLEHVRITDWLDVEPTAVLESGYIACSVNHGGANSFFEAISAGVPQVILPVWGDTYDFAKRAEWLGIGKFGNPRHAPDVDARELGRNLEKVLFGPRAQGIKEKAQRLADLCRDGGGGRRIAAEHILQML